MVCAWRTARAAALFCTAALSRSGPLITLPPAQFTCAALHLLLWGTLAGRRGQGAPARAGTRGSQSRNRRRLCKSRAARRSKPPHHRRGHHFSIQTAGLRCLPEPYAPKPQVNPESAPSATPLRHHGLDRPRGPAHGCLRGPRVVGGVARPRRGRVAAEGGRPPPPPAPTAPENRPPLPPAIPDRAPISTPPMPVPPSTTTECTLPGAVRA